MKPVPVWVICFCGAMVFPFFVFAAGTVKISEIAWMGTAASANDEWLELKNETSSPIPLDGWTLKAEDGQPSIILSGTLAGNGYFLLERTDDNAVPGITADVVYSGALSNSGEVLVLRDASGVEQDRVSAQGGWIAGDNNKKTTMQWVGGVWTTGVASPRSPNIAPVVKNTPEKTTTAGAYTASQNKAPATQLSGRVSKNTPVAVQNSGEGATQQNPENVPHAPQNAQTATATMSPMTVNMFWLLGSIVIGLVVGGVVKFVMQRKTG